MSDLSPRDGSQNPTTSTPKTLLPSAFAVSSNGIACEAITAKLTEVSRIAESLDVILKELQETLDGEQDSLDATDAFKNGQSNGTLEVSLIDNKLTLCIFTHT